MLRLSWDHSMPGIDPRMQGWRGDWPGFPTFAARHGVCGPHRVDAEARLSVGYGTC